MKRFLIKGVATLVLVLGGGFTFFQFYGIGIDRQVVKCLPYTVYLVAQYDQTIEKGEYFT